MSSSAVLARIAEDGRILEWSARAEDLFRRSRTEAEGHTVAELFQGDSGADSRPVSATRLSGVSVRPVLDGTALTWEVRDAEAGGPGGWDLAVLRTLFAHVPIDLYVLDPALRIVRCREDSRGTNPAVNGRDFFTALHLDRVEEEQALAHRVLITGEAALRRLVRAAPASGTRRPVAYSMSYVPLENADGEVLGLVVCAVDVTDREQAMQRLRFLDDVRATVGTRLEVTSVCEEFTDAVVPAFAGIVVVEVIEDVIRGEEPPLVPVSHDVPLRRVAFRGVVSAHPVDDVHRLPEGTPFSRVLDDLRPRLVPVTSNSSWLSADPARANSIAQSEAHSLIVAPLTVRGQALGVVSFYRHRDEDPFGECDIALAADVCAYTAHCIDNARRYTRERTIASIVKRRLLPQRPSGLSTVDVTAMHITGPGGGGAWYDVIELAGGRSALILGDVSGRGIATATTMGQLRTVIHALAALDLEPDELMARLSDTAGRLAEERAALPTGDPLNREPLTAGCLIAIYDAVDHTCTLVRAGLSEPYLVGAEGHGETVHVPCGPVLAGPDQAPFPATEFPMPPGSTLAIGNEDLPSASPNLKELLRAGKQDPLTEVCDSLAYALRDRHETEKLILLARVRGLPADQVLTVQLGEGLEAVPAARAATREQLAVWGVSADDAFTTELIVSELIGNALRYGAAPYRLRLIRNDRLTCEVRDAGQSLPRLKHARTVDEGGRGLFIVASVADEWGIRYHADGKTVWAQQSTSAASLK
ncbi:ATP-binding SpoIIE family protein phosphatase [Streptomyces fagopyri]|uniref:ATP-binding SpoIIE family protein phosphatase n=1 Tax=Streptomyces fagopyri TaxID=2662397 RepID=UPI0037F16AE1